MRYNHKDIQSTNYNVDIRTITFSILAVILVIISIYFIKIYTNKEQNVITILNSEAANLEKEFFTDIYYSKYFLTLIASDIKGNHNNLQHIQAIFDNYNYASLINNINHFFGWRRYSWIDKNFEEVITSNKDNRKKNELEVTYIKSLILSMPQNQINFYFRNLPKEEFSLKLIYNIFSQSDGEYYGSIILHYDIATMISRLKNTVDKSTHFVILDDKLKVIAQSESNIKNIIDHNAKLSKYLNAALRRGDILKNSNKFISYLDMLRGVNYHTKKVTGLPFIIITNLDNDQIKHNVFNNLVKKFIEVGFFGILLFLGIISVYKRETMLRAKAEKATIIANRATKAKSEFLAFTAHEIRSPLGFIVTGAEVMSREFLGVIPEVYKPYAQGIYQNSIMILDFIKDILDESKIIDGKFKITNAVMSIEGVIQESIVMNKARFSERKVELYSQLNKNLPNLIGDKRRLLQVLNNIVSNAIKYSRDHTRVIIRAEVVTEGLKIEIEDQGIGMTRGELKNITESISMTVKNHNNTIESYGLGLLIVKMLLVAHDTKLVIESRKNIGTKVKIIFPRYKLV